MRPTGHTNSPLTNAPSAAEPLWIAGRRKVLARFLDRANIYATPEFHASHEAAARENRHRALAALTSPVGLDRHLR